MKKRVLNPTPLFDPDAAGALALEVGLKEQHLRVLWRSAAQSGEVDISRLPAAAATLLERCAVSTSRVTRSFSTSAEAGFKLVIALQDGAEVETVAIVHEADGGKQGRITVRVSSQVGCKMGCTFCATGTMGFIGNLTAGEILEQARGGSLCGRQADS